MVAAARAFGSRDPDESVRNPDYLADRLIGPAELALISDHPISKGLDQDFTEAMQNVAIVFLVREQIVRTRFIDDAMERAVKNGATQVVILGAGFDTRAYRCSELLKDCSVFEVDVSRTGGRKRARVAAASLETPANLTLCEVDFLNDDWIDVLRVAGYDEHKRTFFIWEGVSMYLAEERVRKLLEIVRANSPAGSTLVLDYPNTTGIELIFMDPEGLGQIMSRWGEPWIFGVPGADGREFFISCGFDPGVPVSSSHPEIAKRYTTRSNGKDYMADLIEKMRAEAQSMPQWRQEMGLKFQKAMAELGGIYWFAELTVPDRG